VYGELLAAASGYHDRVQFIQSPSTQVTLPERADVIIADVHDTFGFQEGGLGALVDARTRFLRPGGTLVPSGTQLLIAPVEAPDLYQRTVEIWQRQVHGVDVSVLRTLAVNQHYPARFQPDQLIAPAAPIALIDLATTESLSVAGDARMEVTRAATLHGLCGCFVTTLADGIVMKNVPGESDTTNFAQAFFPIDTPQALEPGDTITVGLWSYDNSQLRWRIGITDGTETRRHLDHATFLSRAIRADRLATQVSDYHPRLTARGEMERALLERFDGGASSYELQQWLFRRYPEQLPSLVEAVAFLKATIERCG
jgi:protein arginine N-methyltransferase 1